MSQPTGNAAKMRLIQQTLANNPCIHDLPQGQCATCASTGHRAKYTAADMGRFRKIVDAWQPAPAKEEPMPGVRLL